MILPYFPTFSQVQGGARYICETVADGNPGSPVLAGL